MPETLKQLAQASPAAAADTDLYVNATALGFACSAIWVVNTTGAPITYRLYSVAPGGPAYGAADAIVYEKTIGPNVTDIWQGGITGANGHKIGCRASAAGVTFTAYGAEES